MKVSSQLIQVKSLIEELLKDEYLIQKCDPADIVTLQNFLKGESSIANVIEIIQKIKKTKTD